MTVEQRDYHEQRAREELDRAATAGSASAERLHRELAELHMDKARTPGNILSFPALARA